MATSLRAAVAALADLDPIMAGLIAEHGPPAELARRGRAAKNQTRFEALAEAIAYQQLAGKAAEAIWKRTLAITNGPFTPEAVLAAGPAAVRAAGSSNAKTAALMDLAEKVASGAVRLERIGRMTDAEVVAHLTQVRGIGPWTAEMFLIFNLGRLDVWPVLDYGVRAGYARAYGLPELPTSKDLMALGDAFRPYRTLAAWYCWRAISP